MELFLNGENIKTKSLTLAKLIAEKGFDTGGLIIELNQKIIQKENFDHVFLNNGDKIECITFVGGG